MDRFASTSLSSIAKAAAQSTRPRRRSLSRCPTADRAQGVQEKYAKEQRYVAAHHPDADGGRVLRCRGIGRGRGRRGCRRGGRAATAAHGSGFFPRRVGYVWRRDTGAAMAPAIAGSMAAGCASDGGDTGTRPVARRGSTVAFRAQDPGAGSIQPRRDRAPAPCPNWALGPRTRPQPCRRGCFCAANCSLHLRQRPRGTPDAHGGRGCGAATGGKLLACQYPVGPLDCQVPSRRAAADDRT